MHVLKMVHSIRLSKRFAVSMNSIACINQFDEAFREATKCKNEVRANMLQKKDMETMKCIRKEEERPVKYVGRKKKFS